MVHGLQRLGEKKGDGKIGTDKRKCILGVSFYIPVVLEALNLLSLSEANFVWECCVCEEEDLCESEQDHLYQYA